MQITFSIQYKTVFGEELLLNIVGGQQGNRTVAMSTTDGFTWTCEVEASMGEQRVDYYYSVRNSCGIKCSEWKTIMHRIDLNARYQATHIYIVRLSPTASTDAQRAMLSRWLTRRRCDLWCALRSFTRAHASLSRAKALRWATGT